MDVLAKPLATVDLWAYPPEFGQKILIPPPPPEQLNWPTTYGPNYEGRIDGALLTPAQVMTNAGLKPVAGVRIRITPTEIESQVRVGIIPFKEST